MANKGRFYWTFVASVAALVGGSPSAAQDGVAAKASWWERTASSVAPSRTHRVRSDLDARRTSLIATEVDTIAAAVDRALGTLRPRESAPRDLLIFATREDLDDTLRSQLAVEPLGPIMAFRSPLGHGIAFTEEDAPGPIRERTLAAALACEVLRGSCGGDLPVALQSGIADLVARGWAGVGAGSGGIGDAAVHRVRAAIDAGTALATRELLQLDGAGWSTRCAADSAGALSEQAASLVRMLAGTPRSPEQQAFLQYLRELSLGASHPAAIAAVYGIVTDGEWAEFDRRWREFAKSERASPEETARERLAFLGEGLSALEAEGETPSDLAGLERDLKDRAFVTPRGWRPGFSVVHSSWQGVFTPGESSMERADLKERPSARSARAAAFVLNPPRVTGDDRHSPPEITTSGGKVRLRLSWQKTRSDPEAPWVWLITPMD